MDALDHFRDTGLHAGLLSEFSDVLSSFAYDYARLLGGNERAESKRLISRCGGGVGARIGVCLSLGEGNKVKVWVI